MGSCSSTPSLLGEDGDEDTCQDRGHKDGFGCLRGAERARNGHEDCLKTCKRQPRRIS